jgi:putative peptidoglycan lipid II flippase
MTDATPESASPTDASSLSANIPNNTDGVAAPTGETAAQPARKPPSLLKAAGLIAAVTILSKLLGMLRDIGIGSVYGASMISDAYFAAFQLPSFAIVLLGGLGGPFHTATVAVFSRLIKDGEHPDERAKKLASTFLTLTGLVFAVLSLVVFLLAESIMTTILHGASPEKITIAANQLRIMSPIIFTGGLVGIFYGLLNVYHVFFWPSLSPAALSLFILVVLFAFPNQDHTGQMLAWATLGGAILQVAIQLPDFLKRRFSLAPALDWKAPEVRQVCEILFPALISTTIGQLNVYVDMFFTSYLPVGGWTAVILGNRLIQFPIGVLQTALLVPIFPRFSRNAGERNFEAIKRDFKIGVVSLWLISIPMLVILLLYTQTIIRLIFQHGHFDARGTELVSAAMIGLAFQILPYFARDSITRVFFAFHDSRTPLIVGLIAIFFNAFFDWLFAGPLHMAVMGITLSTTAVTLINMILLGILSKKHIQDLGFKEMVAPFCKLLLAGSLMAGTIYGVRALLLSPTGPLFQAVSSLSPTITTYVALILAAMAGLAVYVVAALALKVSEAQYLQERVGGMLSRRLKR